MRKISKHELPVTWTYWFCVGIFLIFFCGGICLIFTEDGKDRGVGVAVSLVAFTLGIGGLLWPILRRREIQCIATEWVRTAEVHSEAILFPCSRVKQYITLFGPLLLGAGAAGLAYWADDAGNRVKAMIGVAFWFGVFGLALNSIRHGRLGILLVPEGVIWRELLRSPYFIPWEAVAETGLFMKKERHNPRLLLTFGLVVTDPAQVKTTYWSRRKLLESRAKTGWHLYFFAETILAPLPLVAGVVDHYHLHPETRREIGTSAGLARVENIEAQLPVGAPQDTSMRT